MYVRSPMASAVFKVIIVAFVVFAVARSIHGYGAGTLRYFTIQSNILVAAATLYLLVDVLRGSRPRSASANGRPDAGLDGGRTAAYVRGIALLAISLTGIVFHTLLAPVLPSPIGFDSQVLHTVVPIAFVLDWLVFSRKGRFRFRDVPVWMVYPIVYLVATLLVAAYYDGFYPYPFMDAGAKGYAAVAVNCVLLLVAFAALGAVYAGADKLMARWGRARP